VQESLLNAANPDMRKFKAAGGKLMLYAGWNDTVIPAELVDYYDTVERTMGGRAATQNFFRVFMVPGMNHCTGGEGPFAIDYLSYMEAWVERGQVPDKMIGAHVPGLSWGQAFGLKFPLDPSTAITFTRPIYPYPLWAKYKGSGDPNKAENFKPFEP
jgi:feruloyl esterase